jgi:hypothetical protein
MEEEQIMTIVTLVGGACAAGLIGAVLVGAQEDPPAKSQELATQLYCASEMPYCGCTTSGQGCFVPAVSWAMLGQAGK